MKTTIPSKYPHSDTNLRVITFDDDFVALGIINDDSVVAVTVSRKALKKALKKVK